MSSSFSYPKDKSLTPEQVASLRGWCELDKLFRTKEVGNLEQKQNELEITFSTLVVHISQDGETKINIR